MMASLSAKTLHEPVEQPAAKYPIQEQIAYLVVPLRVTLSSMQGLTGFRGLLTSIDSAIEGKQSEEAKAK